MQHFHTNPRQLAVADLRSRTSVVELKILTFQIISLTHVYTAFFQTKRQHFHSLFAPNIKPKLLPFLQCLPRGGSVASTSLTMNRYTQTVTVQTLYKIQYT